MKLRLLNEYRDNPIKLDYSSVVASFFTRNKNPNFSFALEPNNEDEEDEDKIDHLEDAVDDMTSSARYGRSSNFTRINTGGEDEVRGGK